MATKSRKNMLFCMKLGDIKRFVHKVSPFDLRPIDPYSMKNIEEDMQREFQPMKFDIPTVNFSAPVDLSKCVAPVSANAKVWNAIAEVDFPCLQGITDEMLKLMSVSDGRHRLASLIKLSGEEPGFDDSLVIIQPSFFFDVSKARIDSFLKSANRAHVTECISDILTCLTAVQTGTSTKLIIEEIKALKLDLSRKKMDTLVSFHTHLFPKVRDLMGILRHTNIFVNYVLLRPENKFINFVKLCGRPSVLRTRTILTAPFGQNPKEILRNREQIQLFGVIFLASLQQMFDDETAHNTVLNGSTAMIEAIMHFEKKRQLLSSDMGFFLSLSIRNISSLHEPAAFISEMKQMALKNAELLSNNIFVAPLAQEVPFVLQACARSALGSENKDGSRPIDPVKNGNSRNVSPVQLLSERQPDSASLAIESTTGGKDKLGLEGQEALSEVDAVQPDSASLAIESTTGGKDKLGLEGQEALSEVDAVQPDSASLAIESTTGGKDKLGLEGQEALSEVDAVNKLGASQPDISTASGKSDPNEIDRSPGIKNAGPENKEDCAGTEAHVLSVYGDKHEDSGIATPRKSTDPSSESGDSSAESSDSSAESGDSSGKSDVSSGKSDDSPKKSGDSLPKSGDSTPKSGDFSPEISPSSGKEDRKNQDDRKTKGDVIYITDDDEVERNNVSSGAIPAAKKAVIVLDEISDGEVSGKTKERRSARKRTKRALFSPQKPTAKRSKTRPVKKAVSNVSSDSASKQAMCAFDCLRLGTSLVDSCVHLARTSKVGENFYENLRLPIGDTKEGACVFLSGDQLNHAIWDGVRYIRTHFKVCSIVILYRDTVVQTDISQMRDIGFHLAEEHYLCHSSWKFGSAADGLLAGLVFRPQVNGKTASQFSRYVNGSPEVAMVSLVQLLSDPFKKVVKHIFDLRVANEVLSAVLSHLGPKMYYKDSNQSVVKVLTEHAGILRSHVQKFCSCGGHEFLTDERSEAANEHIEKKSSAWGQIPSSERPFVLSLSKNDVLLIPQLKTHTSLAIKTTFNGTTEVTSDSSRLCEQKHDSHGRPFHLGVYLQEEGLSNLLDRPEDEIDAIQPKASMYDTNTVHRDLANALSNFELRELFVAGVSNRIYSFMFHDDSIASYVNHDEETCCMIYEPCFSSLTYLSGLEDKGFEFFKQRLPVVLRVQLKSLREKRSKLLQCPTCKAYELFANYGKHYVHYN